MAWLDLEQAPFVLETPDFGDRYYSFQIGYADTECDLCPGLRTHGPQLPPLFLHGPTYRGSVPDGDAPRGQPHSLRDDRGADPRRTRGPRRRRHGAPAAGADHDCARCPVGSQEPTAPTRSPPSVGCRPSPTSATRSFCSSTNSAPSSPKGLPPLPSASSSPRSRRSGCTPVERSTRRTISEADRADGDRRPPRRRNCGRGEDRASRPGPQRLVGEPPRAHASATTTCCERPWPRTRSTSCRQRKRSIR